MSVQDSVASASSAATATSHSVAKAADAVATAPVITDLKDVVANMLIKSLNALQDGAVWFQGQIPDIIKGIPVLECHQGKHWDCHGLV